MPSAKLDPNGQPTNRLFNAQRVADRATDELIGLSKGMLADGIINDAESKYLIDWLIANEEARTQWPGNVLYARVCEYLEDGILDVDESEELFDFLSCLTGKGNAPETYNTSTALPYNDPMPELQIDGEAYCLTGRFAYGSRKECQREIKSLGGSVHGNPLKKGCILVVGCLGNKDWMHSTHGRKIEKAIEYRDAGHPVVIVSEDHWTNSLVDILGLK